MPSANYTQLLSLLGDFYREHENLPQFKKFWEGLIRVVDNEWLQLQQTKNSLTTPFLPTLIRHSHLYRKVETWGDTGVFHRHVKKWFRSVSGQKVYYLGVFVNPQETRVYIEGKELDLETGAYSIVYDQDTTQPVTNPRGSRLIFSQDIPGGSSIHILSDRETFWIDKTVVTPSDTLSYGGIANDLSVQVMIDAQDITSQVTFNGSGTEIQFAASGFTNPNSTDTRLFRTGEVLRVVEPSGATTEVTVLQDTQVVGLSAAVSTSSSVFRVINLNITPGMIVLEADRLSTPGQSLPPNVSVRVRDSGGLQTFDITAPTSSISLGRPVNVAEAEVTLLSGTIYNGIDIGAEEITFNRAFQVGTRFHVRGDYHLMHDHTSLHQVMNGTDDTIWVPIDRPFVVQNTPSGIIEDPQFPIEVYVDGALIPKDDWIFLPSNETVAVRLVATGQPTPVLQGTNVNIFWVDLEDKRLHKHVRDHYLAVDGQIAFQLSEPHDLRYPVYPMLDGFLQGDTDNYGYAGEQAFLHITPPTANDVIVEIRGARLEYPFIVDLDLDVENYMFVEEDVSPARVTWAQTLKNGLDTEQELPVQSGNVVLEEGFTVSPILPTASGFTLKASEKWEDVWFLQADVDEQTAWRNFGFVIDFKRATSEDYVRVVQALFAAYFRGSQRYTLENFTNLVMGASFLDVAATLSRIQEGRLERDAIVTSVNGETLSYELSNQVPDSLWHGKEMPKFHALTAYCKILDLTAENFPWLPVAAGDFSDGFSFAKSFDYQTPSLIEGVDPVYDPISFEFVDETKDFVNGPDGTVWPGDLVEVSWSGGFSGFGRITDVIDNNRLRVRLEVPESTVSYGQESYGGGPPGRTHAYGGTRVTQYLQTYKIWVRKLRKLDSHHFLDSMSPEELAYVTGVLVPLFDKFVFLVKLHWEGLNEGLLGDVKHFLDTAKPAASRYIAFSNVNEDDGISDGVGIEFVEEPVELEIITNIFAVGLSALDGGDPIGASIEVA